MDLQNKEKLYYNSDWWSQTDDPYSYLLAMQASSIYDENSQKFDENFLNNCGLNVNKTNNFSNSSSNATTTDDSNHFTSITSTPE